MSDNTSIEWTDATWNPLRARLFNTVNGQHAPVLDRKTRKPVVGWHCEHVSEACRNCYAEGINWRLGTGLDFKPSHKRAVDIYLDEKTLLHPLRWKRPRMIFVCSMTDLFGDWVTDAQLDRIFAVMALCPQHTFQVLTKRPARMRAYLSSVETMGRVLALTNSWIQNDGHCEVKYEADGLPGFFLPNVWLLVSCGDQPDADTFIPILLDTPAAVRGVSLEPLLGPIDLGDHLRAFACHECFNGRTRVSGHFFDERCQACRGTGVERPRLDWCIVGGESGPRARPMKHEWAQSLRDQCEAAGVSFFFKQWGEFAPDERTRRTLQMQMIRVGKKRAGRLLDGVEHNGFPEVPA